MKVITLSCSSLTARIAPELGSNMFSFTYKNHELIFSDNKTLEKGGFTGTYVLFPTPNRVKDFVYTWQGKQYTLQKNEKKVHIHHQLVFDQPFQILRSDRSSVTTSITIDKHSHLFAGFPFPCTLTLQYRLRSDGIHIQYTVTNLGNEALPFGFGLHPHFRRLSGDDKTLISIPATSVMDTISDTLLPNGKLTPVRPLHQTPVGELSLDHAFTNIQPRRYATIDYKREKFNVVLKTSNDFTHIVVWTGHPKAICIENQTCSADAHNLWARGFKKESHLLTVAPGKSRTGYIEYVISS